MAVEELCFAKQSSMNSGEFYAHVVKIVKRCKFPCAKAEERAIRDTIFLGMNSTKARDKAINLMNEEGKELKVDFLMQQLEIEDCSAHHKSLSQLDSSMSVNFAAYDHQQNKGKNSKKNRGNGKDQGQNKSGAQGSSNSSHQSRKPPGMEDKCMRCGKHEHQLGQRCPAKNAKCKECHKIGHFHKVCQSKKRATQRANLVQTPQDDDNTHIDKNRVRQPNPPPRVNMLKVVNHTEAIRGRFNEGKHLIFPIASHLRGPYNHHIVVREDTGADVNCMNGNTFNELFPEVQLSVCPHEIQNFGNSVVDISILGQFCTYLEFRGEKYLNTFIVTNANDCPNLLSYGATFRMGVLLPNYPQDIVVKGENVPHFGKMSGDKMRAPNGTSNVFQILGDIQKQQLPVQSQYDSSIIPVFASPFRTTTPSTPALTMVTAKQENPVHVNAFPMQNTSQSGPPAPCAHVDKLPPQVLKPRDSLALRKVQHPHNVRTSVNRLPLTKQVFLSHYSSCFEGIGHFPGEPYKFHLKPEHKPARHAPRKNPIHL